MMMMYAHAHAHLSESESESESEPEPPLVDPGLESERGFLSYVVDICF